jgi:hypothetical protein
MFRFKKLFDLTIAILAVAALFSTVAHSQSYDYFLYLPLVSQSEATSTPTPTSTPTLTPTPTATPTTTPGSTLTPRGAYTQSGGTATLNYQAITATSTDESGVEVKNSGTFTLTDSLVTTSGNTSSSDNSSFYGLNAAVLAESASKIYLSNVAISTRGTGANGAFATGSGSSVVLSNVTITATNDGGHGVMATQGGALTMTDVDINTTAAHSAPIATDRGGGTITAVGGTLVTTGQDSPCIYSTGSITVSDATCTTPSSEMVVIEGANSITLQNTSLTTSKADKWGVMIYQSMSGDAQGTQGTFTMTGGSLADTAATGPLFYVTNSTGIITLNGVNVTVASGTLVKAATGNWGTSGSNGGTANLTANGQTLTGNLVADSISSITAALKNSSTLTGAIDSANTAKTVNLTLDSTSTWTVTADSHLTCLSDSAGISGTAVTNITGNGHTVYYSSSSCSALGGTTYTLNGGGYLQPES